MDNKRHEEISFFHPKIIIGTCILTGTILGSYKFYSTNFRRISSSSQIPQKYFHRQFIYGKVTSVGDGDNFHLFHLPGGRLAGWHWLRLTPKVNDFKKLKKKTIHVRLCGVDAPERSHFGKPSQPFSEEALEWLRYYILGKNVWVKPLSIDQYQRVVGKVLVWKFTGWKDVSEQMIKNGVAIVYEGKASAEFDGKEQVYRELEAEAKKKKKGLWFQKLVLTPGQYKKFYK
ncbi:hypothetical protein PACTADRAFT_36542 [Pachysolen tannophilus NRRL Y-2460]|uniref:Probable endonuclease LCL3 n=1 Tax=Pachysolen tannophilus NRRL Y-2460 TaxID=669874 RepID=A0A1E4U2Z2_PACTA|nr:hypothetical protein PACTADRAFT_36542 [Pachysolen tannophilus NRRL Y-2460]